MTHPQSPTYQSRTARQPPRWCWSCLNSGYRGPRPCTCTIGTLARVHEGPTNLYVPAAAVPLAPAAAQLERVHAGIVAAGIAPARTRVIA